MAELVASGASDDARWVHLSKILERESPFGNETGDLANAEYRPGPEVFKSLRDDSKVLVIGAGGLGCEILKNLALSGVTDIHVIDLDTIDLTNLNRQFLFRRKDIGRGKAEVAAEFIMQRVPGCKVTPYNCKIQSKPREFYEQFKVVVSGLDNIEARCWLSSMLVNITEKVEDEDGDVYYDNIIPMIDGGTEGFKGQARVIVPKCTACFDCIMESIAPPTGFAMCTITETPRIPEHCIAYAYMSLWEKEFPEKKVDKDSPADMQWIFEKAAVRADTFGIEGVTYFMTMGVVKSIIPAIASTNATIAAACCHEALKIITASAQSLNNNFMIIGQEGFFSATMVYDRKMDCISCGTDPKEISCSSTMTLQDLFTQLKEDPEFVLKNPSAAVTLRCGTQQNLYFPAPEAMRKATAANLERTLKDLGLSSGDFLGVTDLTRAALFNLKLLLD